MDLASNPTITGVTAENNGSNAVTLDWGTLAGDGFWDDPDIVYQLSGDVTVPAGATLTLAGGQVVIGDQGGWVYCIAKAPEGEPVNASWFVTRFPPARRTNHDPRGITTLANPAPPPQTYTDTSSGFRSGIFEPAYGPAWQP